MEEILDQAFNEKEKDETRINRMTAIIRYVFSIGYAYLVIRSSIVFPAILEGNYAEAVGGLLATILLLIPIRYNIKHANLEFKNRYVKSTYKRKHIISFLVFSFLIIGAFSFSFTSAIIRDVSLSRYDYYFLLLILRGIFFIGSLLWISYREFVYLKRISKSQNFVNQ